MAKVYVTKYALTAGIRVCEVDRDYGDNTVSVKWPTGLNGTMLFHNGEWHRTREDAEHRVQEMVTGKLRSIDKQRTKLLEMRTNGVPVHE